MIHNDYLYGENNIFILQMYMYIINKRVVFAIMLIYIFEEIHERKLSLSFKRKKRYKNKRLIKISAWTKLCDRTFTVEKVTVIYKI